MAVFTAKSAGSTGMKEYSIILNSFQPLKNSFASKTGTLVLLWQKLANGGFTAISAGATVIGRLVLIITLYIYVFALLYLFEWVLYNNYGS
jgi:hypothetical protein